MNVFQDKSGCVWIGTETGLNKFDPYKNQFKQLGGEAIDLLAEQTATSFCVLPSLNINSFFLNVSFRMFLSIILIFIASL